ncbi:MAG: hypothetical protein MZU79_02435 [Anaerotruncus sp.]|nr:hypothetical protein [Anaerotruncus sp.]
MNAPGIREIWTSREGTIAPSDLYRLAGERSFALLSGDGPGCRFLMFAEDPIFTLDDLPCSPPGRDFRAFGRYPPGHPRFHRFHHLRIWGEARTASRSSQTLSRRFS